MTNPHRSAAASLAAALALFLLIPQALSASGVSAAQGELPVTFYQWTAVRDLALDPQTAADPTSVDLVENLFLSLTDYDARTGAIEPELALGWTIAPDGQTFTFALRSDVSWVRYDPARQLLARVRPVTAQDFVDGLRRACSPSAAQPVARLLASIVEGCDRVYQAAPEAVTPDVLAQVGAEAPAPDTLIIRTRAPAGWFLALTPMLRAVPFDVIRRQGNAWTLPGNLVSNGPFVLSRYDLNQRVELLRANPHLPAALNGPGNVERVVYDIVSDVDAGYALYLSHKVDISRLALDEEAAFMLAGRQPPETVLLPELRVGYVGFAQDRAPFNDARVRRAFAASIDRKAFVDRVLGGMGFPLAHLAPPGVFGAPARESGDNLGYDPAFARAQLAAAGYAECFGFPVVTFMAYDSAAAWVDFLLASWREVLGCTDSAFNVELVRFPELLARTAPETPSSLRPHLFTLAWRGDYPDEHNWVGALLWCEAGPRTRRACTETDDLIARAAAMTNPASRREQYVQVEAAFFGAAGEMPIIPLYQRASWLAVKSWVLSPVEVDAVLYGMNWDRLTIDAGKQERCRAGDAAPDECRAPFVFPTPAGLPTTRARAETPAAPTEATATLTPTVRSVPALPTRMPSPTPTATPTP